MKVNLKNQVGYRWFSKNGINIRGYFYLEGKFYNNEEMLKVFEQIESIECFSELLKRINGFYSVVIIKNDYLLAATDRINSMPLFFSMYNKEIKISDDYRDMLTKNLSFDQTAIAEYLLLGYTTGNYTLYENIKQLKPGEFLHYDLTNKKIQISRYYEYLHNNINFYSEKEFVNKLKNVHEKVFKRFVDSLEGRPVIVPLSGGYDSRLIVEMLYKYNYENVICVTWGKSNDWQVKIAKDVASKLDFKWININHKGGDWNNWFLSGEYEKLNVVSGCISSIPYLQENVSISYLEKKYDIPKDSIFVSGNSGDFIQGEHIPEDLISEELFNSKKVVDIIYQSHFRLFKLKDISISTSVKERIIEVIGKDDNFTSEQAANIFEYWEWQERQSKFVTNSVKAFEVKGYEWRLPLWDNEIMDFWSTVPLKYRYKRNLFYKYANCYMEKNVLPANPRINKIKIYKERLMDSRYGCFTSNYNMFRGFFLKDIDIFDDPIVNLVENKPILLHKINGLLALWNLIHLKKETEKL